MFKQPLKRSLIAVLAVSQLAVFSAVPVAQAAMLGTPEIIQQHQQQVNKAELRNMLNDQQVQNKLQELGVDRAQVEQRINSLTPAELAHFNQQLTEAPAGAGWAAVIVLFLVIFMITDALCVTNLFHFMKCL